MLRVSAQPFQMSNLQCQIQKNSHQVIIIINYNGYNHMMIITIIIIIIVLVLIFSLLRDFFAEKLLELLDRKCRFEVFGCEFISKVCLCAIVVDTN